MDRVRVGWASLALAIVASGIFMLVIGHGQTLVNDEWSYLVNRQGWSPEVFLRPQNGHLVALPLVLYKVWHEVFGISSYFPYELLSFGTATVIVIIVYLLARPGLGPLGAVLPALLILFCGTGWDTVLSAYQVPNLLGMAAGIGALLALQREDRTGLVFVFLLLAVSLASFTVGLAFAVGIAVSLGMRGREFALKRAWVVAVPLVLWLGWFAWARKYHEGGVTQYGVASVAGGVLDQVGAICSGLTGLFLKPAQPDLASQLTFRSDWSAVLTAGFFGLLFLRVRSRQESPVSPLLLVVGAVLLAYLVLVGVAIAPGREPAVGRYVFMGSVLVLVVLAVAARGLELRDRHVAMLAVLVAIALIANISALILGSRILRGEAQTNRAELGALEIVGPGRAPEDIIEPPDATLLSHPDMFFTPAQYFDITAEEGTPAFDQAELSDAPEQAREAADLAFFRLLPITVEPGPATPKKTGPPVEESSIAAGTTRSAGSCLVVRPSVGAADATVTLPPGGFTYRAAKGVTPEILLGRFGDGLAIAETVPPGSGTVLIPADESDLAWRAEVRASSPVSICPAP